MKINLYPISCVVISLFAFFVTNTPSFAGISFNQNQAEITLAPTCNHVPIGFPYIDDGSFDESSVTASSDSGWAIPSVDTDSNRIEITFATEDLIASYTATISINDGESVTELFIHATVSSLDVYRLLDDPLRSKTYGIHRNGIYNGSIIAFDPVQDITMSCLTVGESPTDFVINDDSTELLVINSVGRTIDVLDLPTFSIKETIDLPIYSAWGDADDTTANIDLGPGNIIYYTDGTWGPVLHVLNRSSGAVLQSIKFDGSTSSSNITGFMDFAVTNDKTGMVAMPQYGWSAGVHYRTIGQYSINGNGTVNFVKETTIANISREPFEAPVLIRDDDQIAVMKTISVDPSDVDILDRAFPTAIWSMAPDGSIVATGDKLYEYETGNELYTIPGGSVTGPGYTYTKAQAFTSDFTRFVYFNPSDNTLNVVNLVDEIGLEQLGRSLNPQDGAVVNSPATLTWTPLSGVDQYDIYLGTNETSITEADNTSPFFLGRVTGSSLELTQTLINGTDYFWRIDPVTALGPETGTVYTFTVSDIALSLPDIDAQTVAGHTDYQVDILLESSEPGIAWTASAADSWITFSGNSGSTPSTLRVHLDTTTLLPGFHNSSITLTSETGPVQIPVQIEVEPLVLTHIRSDRNSETVYAISEDSNSIVANAYLLEIDSAAETIQRVIPVGSSVTDFSIHNADDLIYVTNWESGNLLVIDRNSFEHVRSIAFTPAGSTGYQGGDVYRVAAGVSERLIVEEEDQWIDISLFNTETESIESQASVREGGGAFGPLGRYYYHGENNSSGASIIKYDVSGDTLTQLTEVRPPEISSYYGSRTVVVSEDGSRLFWAGVALNQDLETEWATGDIIYSTSADGRYAFADTAIYDINLRRQVLAMPATTNVSGYNSTSNKLMVQVGEDLKFFEFTTPLSLPAPVITARNPTANSVELIWTDNSLEMQFFLQQRLVGAGDWTDIHTTTANVTSWTAVNLDGGSAYEFRVRASSPNYSSPWSNIVTITPDSLDPTIPLLFDPVEIPTGVSLTWSDSSNEAGYVLERSPDGINSWSVIASPGANVTTYTDANVAAEITYYYRIKAVNGPTESGYSVIVSLTTASLIPTTPLLSEPTEIAEGVSLTWSDSSNETGYVLERSPNGIDSWSLIASPAANITTYTDIAVTAETTYYYRIKAIRESTELTESVYSVIVSLTTAALIPTTPVLAEPIEIAQGVSLTWSDSSHETGYVLERSPDGVNNWNEIASTEADVTDYTDTDIAEGTTYYYRIKAIRESVGLTESDYSDNVSLTTASVIPTTPTLYQPIETTQGVALLWTDSSHETSYVLERSPDGVNSWAEFASAEANVTNYTDTSIAEGTTYYYRIKAIRESTQITESNYSVIREVTTRTGQLPLPQPRPSPPPKPDQYIPSAGIMSLLLGE